MKVYQMISDSNRYKRLVLANDEDSGWWKTFRGQPVGDTWLPIAVRVEPGTLTEFREEGDFPYLSRSAPVLSRSASEALLDLLSPHGELLPLVSEEGNYLAYNVTTVIDALDLDGAEIAYFRDGEIMGVDVYAFRAERLRTVPIFKLPGYEYGYVFVTDVFVQRVAEAQLKGFRFDEVWTSDN